jgi:hypothetical protein
VHLERAVFETGAGGGKVSVAAFDQGTRGIGQGVIAAVDKLRWQRSRVLFCSWFEILPFLPDTAVVKPPIWRGIAADQKEIGSFKSMGMSHQWKSKVKASPFMPKSFRGTAISRVLPE